MTLSDSNNDGRILLVCGASNVALSATVLAEVAAEGPSPYGHLVLVGGHGRSLAKATRVLGRRLPAWMEGGLERQLSQLGARERRLDVILTDIGNDLIYGLRAQRLTALVERVLSRLDRFGPACSAIALPPMKRLRDLGPAEIQASTALLFPKHRPDPEWLVEQSLRLSEGLHRLARERDLVLIEPARAWYAIDPIHLRRRARRAAWRNIVCVVKGGIDQGKSLAVDAGAVEAGAVEAGSPLRLLGTRERLRLAWCRPPDWRFLGLRLGRPPSSTVLTPGSSQGIVGPSVTVYKC